VIVQVAPAKRGSGVKFFDEVKGEHPPRVYSVGREGYA
jgi:hypothetical protein